MRQNRYGLSNIKILVSASDIGNEKWKTSVLAPKKLLVELYWKYTLMNTVRVSFDTTVRQMTKMTQQKKNRTEVLDLYQFNDLTKN